MEVWHHEQCSWCLRWGSQEKGATPKEYDQAENGHLTEPELMEQTNTFPISILHISIDLMTHKGIINYVIHWMMCNDLKVSDKTIITCRQNN